MRHITEHSFHDQVCDLSSGIVACAPSYEGVTLRAKKTRCKILFSYLQYIPSMQCEGEREGLLTLCSILRLKEYNAPYVQHIR